MDTNTPDSREPKTVAVSTRISRAHWLALRDRAEREQRTMAALARILLQDSLITREEESTS
jgi:hypothetical protein